MMQQKGRLGHQDYCSTHTLIYHINLNIWAVTLFKKITKQKITQ